MIKRIIHIADIHVHTTQLHNLYKNQFTKFLSEINKHIIGLTVDEVRIVITGDLFHQKINISNEQILLISWFLNELLNFGQVIIIPGNHDFLVNNMERIDSVTPIVKLFNNKKISYFKNGGVYEDENINWVVYSLYQHNQRPQFIKKDGYFYIGLFHGPIQGLSTDLGYTFDDAYDRLNFIDLDLLLCGDIHKRQTFKLASGGDAVMIGSFIQQDFGEDVKHHGYGIFDMETKKYSFYDLQNNQPFLFFRINDIKDIETETENLVNFG